MRTTGATSVAPPRRLRRLERAFVTVGDFAPLNLVVDVHTAGPSLADVLPLALERLQERHPLLGARVGSDGHAPVFRFDQPRAIPVRRLAPGAGPSIPAVEAELADPFDTRSGPLARCAYSPASGQLLLTFHHAIADGPFVAAFADEVLTSCQGLLEGRALAAGGAARHPQMHRPPPAYRNWRGARNTASFVRRMVAEEIGMRVANRGALPPGAIGGRSRIVPVRLDRDGTAALVSAARRRRVTTASLLLAALLRAAEDQLGDAGRRHRGLVWIDVRRRLDPPVPSSEAGCHISMLRFVVTARGSVWSTAEQIGDAIARAARRGDGFGALRLSDTLVRVATRWPTTRLATAAISYAPWSAPARSYGGIAVRAVSGAVSNNAIGAEIAAVAGVFDGQLWCNLICLDTDVSADEAAELGLVVHDVLVTASR